MSLNKVSLLKESFLSNYLLFTEHQESPEEFHLWTAVTIIGAATQRKVFYDQLYYKLYPNLYTGLISKSAISRKSSAMDIGMGIYEATFEDALVQTSVLKGKITPSAVIEEMAPSKKNALVSGQMFIQSDELSILLASDVRQAGIVELLTSLYTCPATYDYKTKTAGKYKITDAFVNILAGTVPSYMHSAVGSAKEEGFIGRFDFTIQEGRKIATPRIKEVVNKDDNFLIKEVLIKQLQAMAFKEGAYEFTSEAGRRYDFWYEHIPTEAEKYKSATTLATGFVGRKGDHGIKLAIILALARDPMAEGELIIDLATMDAAIALVESADLSLRKIFDRMPGEDALKYLPEIEDFFMKKKRVSKTVLNSHWFRKIDPDNMSKVLWSLQEARVIFKREKGRVLYYYYVAEEFRTAESIEEVYRKTLESYGEV